MNIQSLRYFISLAKTKNYTKAAESCYISQPALSRSISELQKEIGCQLVNKKNRFVELTEEGEIFLIEAKKILKLCDTLIEKVTNIQQFKNPVKVGYIIYGHIGIFNKRLSRMTSSNLIKIETEYDTLYNIREKLMTDEIDIAILPEVCITDLHNIKAFNLIKSQLYVLVPSQNILFKRDFVNFHDLKNQSFIGWDTDEVPSLSDAHSKVCEEVGFKPRFIAYGKKMGDLMTLSILHNALGFASCNSTIVDSKEFKLMPVSDSKENFGLVCIWKQNNKNLSVGKLIEIIRK